MSDEQHLNLAFQLLDAGARVTASCYPGDDLVYNIDGALSVWLDMPDNEYDALYWQFQELLEAGVTKETRIDYCCHLVQLTQKILD